VKRLLDLIAALGLLLVIWPVLVLTALAILVTDGSPVLFRQSRPGWRSRLFTLLKFRTMRAPGEGEDALATDAARLTPLGRILRASSLDELPQLLNIVAGDMSFIGPRPLLPEYLQRYTPEQARRHDVRPGMTGWAQVNGRNATSWEKRFALDVYYVDHLSFALDVRILLRTISTVFSRKGIAADAHATMPEFMGTQRAASSATKEE